jgi:transcriptional regulator with XRE-family HTH domain
MKINMNDEQIRQRCQRFISDLKSLRESKGLSTYKLEELTGLKASNIRRLEGGEYMPNLLTIVRYCEGVGADLSIILK